MAYELSLASGEKVILENTGVDPTGKVLDKLQHNNVDCKLSWCDKFLRLEIKTAPHTRFFTFKVSSLKQCLKDKALIVVFLKNSEFYYCVPLKSVVQLLSLPQEIYSAFSPNDLSVRIVKENFDKYFVKKYWSKQSLDILK